MLSGTRKLTAPMVLERSSKWSYRRADRHDAPDHSVTHVDHDPTAINFSGREKSESTTLIAHRRNERHGPVARPDPYGRGDLYRPIDRIARFSTRLFSFCGRTVVESKTAAPSRRT